MSRLAEWVDPAGDDFGIVHARALNRFPELVASLGGTAEYLLRQVGLSGDRPDTPLTYPRIGRLFELAARTLSCPDFGLRLGLIQSAMQFGPLGTAMRNCRTLGEAQEYACTNSHAHSPAVRVRLNVLPENDDCVFLSHEVLLDGFADRGQLMEQILLVGHLTALEMTGGRARARQVWFQHQPVSSPQAYRRYFGCEVRFGQSVDGCLFSRAALAAPIVASDPKAYRAAATFIEQRFKRPVQPLSAKVRGVIVRLLSVERISSQRIAAELGLHMRTLNRQLRAEGTSFQAIKDEVRCDLLGYYLRQTDLGIASISERLGFAEQSVLTRRCYRWLGMSPSNVRAEARRASPTRD